jgi:hypothetical protein
MFARTRSTADEQRKRVAAPAAVPAAAAAPASGAQRAAPASGAAFGSLPILSPALPAAGPGPSAGRVSSSDSWEQYQKTQDDIAAFQAGAPYFRSNYRVANGFFDTFYLPPYFNVILRTEFNFLPTEREVWGEGDHAAAVEPWTPAEKDAWKQRYIQTVSQNWTNERIALYCTQPGWEMLTAQVAVRVLDVQSVRETMGALTDAEIDPHYKLRIQRLPPGMQYQAETRGPNVDRPWGEVDLGADALDARRRTTGQTQRSAVHESGHMLGLADLYTGGNAQKGAEFQKRATRELGAPVPIADDERLMSLGEKVDLPDAISFVEAIRATTRKPWALWPGKSAPVPHAPEDLNDLVGLRKTVV